MRLDWNKERYRTRDRLLRYDLNAYPMPRGDNKIPNIYPWRDAPLSQLSDAIFELAKQNGYTKSEEDFWKTFSKDDLQFESANDFPVPGDENSLYLDKETGILYYFKIANSINQEQADEQGVIIVSHIIENEKELFYLYMPIQAMPVENLIINGGDSIDLI